MHKSSIKIYVQLAQQEILKSREQFTPKRGNKKAIKRPIMIEFQKKTSEIFGHIKTKEVSLTPTENPVKIHFKIHNKNSINEKIPILLELNKKLVSSLTNSTPFRTLLCQLFYYQHFLILPISVLFFFHLIRLMTVQP